MGTFWKQLFIAGCLLIAVAAVVSTYLLFEHALPTFRNVSSTPLPVQTNEVTLNSSSDEKVSVQETHEPRWTHMPLSYAIYNCSRYEAHRIIDGFSRLANETGQAVSFALTTTLTENSSGTFFTQSTIPIDIEVACHAETGTIHEDGYVTAGDSGYFMYPSKPFEIVKAKVNFYGIGLNTYSGGCPTYPDIEMHEILHAFGFQHVEQYNHIMNPTHSYCPSMVNEDVIGKLKSVYGK